MLGITASLGASIVADEKAASPKFDQQVNILKSASIRFDSALYDLAEIVQADLFDNEPEAATELARKGFTRGAGAIAGVVLEKHLGKIAVKHALKARKPSPTINDGTSS
jgi:hypothetical protein